jgi:hypothetical protein
MTTRRGRGIGAAASVLLFGALGLASYRLVARIPRRPLQLFVSFVCEVVGRHLRDR